jgi:hypothetical protein
MVDREVRTELEILGDPDAMHALVVEWTARPDLSPAADLPTKRERLAFVDRALAAIKEDWLDRFRVEGVEIEDLPGTPQAILRATAGRWLELTSDGGTLDRDQAVRVLPIHLYHALASS